jgi:hypothetical protein
LISDAYVEVWLEKDALAGVVAPVTKLYDVPLGKMAERESRIIASLATKMRISQQTTYDKRRKNGPAGPAPWDFGR